MTVFTFSLSASILIYGFLYDMRLIYINLAIISLYYLCSFMIPDGKYNTIRRKMMISSWDVP